MTDNIKDKYKWITNNSDETQCIGLTPETNTFQGVIYKYTKVSIPSPEEMKDKRDLPLRFEYDIVDSNNLPRNWLETPEFHKIIGDILVDILDEQVQEGTVQFEKPTVED